MTRKPCGYLLIGLACLPGFAKKDSPIDGSGTILDGEVETKDVDRDES